MLTVGLTGNIAAGKSTVARRLAALGATVIDADLLAREVVAPGTPGLARVVQRFGDGVRAADGSLDRAALRAIVFRDPAALADLNDIVHPAVARLRDQRVAEAAARGDRIVVCDIPLLFETHGQDAFDRVWLVDAPVAVRLHRLMADRGLGEREARDMIAAQLPSDLKRAAADLVLDNDGTREALEAKVEAAWAALQRDAGLPPLA